MNEKDLDRATPVDAESPLDRAAEAGTLRWTTDPDADPEGIDDGVPRSGTGLAGFDARG